MADMVPEDGHGALLLHLARADISALASKETRGHFGDRLRVTVGEPKRRTEALQVFIVYKVTTKLDDVEVGSVCRRYSDFCWLQKALATGCSGAVLPALPQKQSVGRFDDDFVEQRRLELQSFVNDVSRHPEALAGQRCFAAFLQATDTSFSTFKSLFKADAPTQQPGRPKNRMPEPVFASVASYADAVEDADGKCQLRVRGVLKASLQLGDALGELGIAFAAVAEDCMPRNAPRTAARAWLRAAGCHASLGDSSEAAAAAAARATQDIAALARAHANRDASALEQNVAGRVSADGALRAALSQRRDCAEVLRLSAKRAAAAAKQLGKLRASQPFDDGGVKKGPTWTGMDLMKQALSTKQSPAEKIARAAGDYDCAAAQLDAAQQALADCDARLGREVGRFEVERGAALRDLVKDYAQTRIAYLDEERAVWTQLANGLDTADKALGDFTDDDGDDDNDAPPPARAAPHLSPSVCGSEEARKSRLSTDSVPDTIPV